MSAAVATPAPRSTWRALLEADPVALPYQTPEWVDAICAAAGYKDRSRQYELPSGRRAVVPLVSRAGLPERLAPAASLPLHWGVGGVVADGPLEPDDVAAIADDLAQLRCLHLRIRPNPLRPGEWDDVTAPGLIRRPRRVHVLDLAGGFEQVWKTRFTKATRTGVRHALEAGVEVESDTTGRLVGEFHEVLSASVDRWAVQQNEPRPLARARFRARDPRRKFDRIADRMGTMCRIWIARHRGQAVAASMRLVLPGGAANASRSAMVKELAAPVRANDLLQKLAIEDACDAGCRWFVQGESGRSRGLAAFKERFGGVPIDYDELHFDRLGVKRSELAARELVKKTIGFRDESDG